MTTQTLQRRTDDNRVNGLLAEVRRRQLRSAQAGRFHASFRYAQWARRLRRFEPTHHDHLV